MNRVILYTFSGALSLLFQSFVFAEDLPIKPGKISLEELLMDRCPLDSNARAMILCDYGKSYIEYSEVEGFLLYYDRVVRIKIFTKEGYDWADHSISLYKDGSNKEKVSSLKACTYNLVDGKIEKEKLKNSDVYTEEVSRHLEMEKFSMPLVREGSVIEIEYTVRSDFFFNLNPWYFQHDIPTLWSEYNTSIPEYFEYKKTMKGYIPLAENEFNEGRKSIMLTTKERSEGKVTQTSYDSQVVEYKEYREHWAARDVQAFIEEEPLTSPENYISKLEFELATIRPAFGPVKNYTKTWEDINDLLIEDSDFGSQLKGGGFLKDAAEEINSSAADDLGKVVMAYNFIQNHMKWDGRNSISVNDNLRSAYDNRAGNSAEVNLMLVLLLDKIGIVTDPVVVSTRSHGVVMPVQPTVSSFNYVLASAHLNDQVYLMDATDPKIPFGMLPKRALNNQGRIVSKTRSGWVSLETDKSDKSFWMYTLAMDDEHRFTGSVQASFTDYGAYRQRLAIGNFGSEEEYVKAVQDNNPGLAVNSHEIINTENYSEPLKQKFDVTISDKTDGSEDLLYFIPLMYEAITENPFKLEMRNYPVEYAYPTDLTCMITFTVPDGYKIDEYPQSTKVQLPEMGGAFLFSSSQVGNSLQIMSKIQITKKIFLPEEYEYLKQFYNHIVAKHAEPVVLSKD